MKDNPLHRLMNPESIAMVGAGNNLTKMGTIQALSIVKGGFKGKFFPIHRKEKTVLGCKAYSSVLALPEVPDLAIIVVPTDQVVTLMDEFGQIGTKRAIIISGGFKETGAKGQKQEELLKETAARYGIRFLGPNCIGVINSQTSLNSTVFAHTAKPGMLGLASQSGTYVAQTLAYLRKRGIRFSKAISMGNEANIDIVDALEYLGEDDDTKAITLYIEGIRDGRRFIEAAQKISPHKPIIAQYVGGTTAGARAGRSHTGSLAGPDYLYDGIFDQAGIIRVQSVDELFGHGWTLATQPRLKGKRVGVVTNSGGPGSTISYTCDKGGLDVPCFSDGLQEEIRKYIPPHASSANPVDFTFFLNNKTLSTTMPEIVMQSNEVDAVILHGMMGSGLLKENYEYFREFLGNIPLEVLLEQFREDLSGSMALPMKYGIPLVVSSFFDGDDDCTLDYQKSNIPVFDAPEKAAKAIASCFKYKKILERKEIIPPVLPAKSAEVEKIIEQALSRGQNALDEHESKQVLAAYGIPVSEERLAHTEQDAVQAARSIGFPVALKGCSSKILHKTEKGLIRLSLNNEGDVIQSFKEIRETAGENSPVLVCKMVEGSREFMTGMARFPGFGPCVLFGVGGVFAEAFSDVTFRHAPLSEAEAEEMISGIKAAKLLDKFRGMPAVDFTVLANILQKVSFLAVLHPEIAEMDVNPIMISGSHPVAADALIVLAGHK